MWVRPGRLTACDPPWGVIAVLEGSGKKTTVKRKILIRTYGLLALIVIGVWAASTFFVINDQRGDEKQQAKSIAVFLAEQLNRTDLWRDEAAIEKYLGDMAKSHFSFDYIVLMDDDRTVSSTITDESLAALPDLHGGISAAGSVATHTRSDGRVVYDAAVAVDGSGLILHVGSPRGALDPNVTTTLRTIAVSSVIALVLGFGLAWMVAALTNHEIEQSEAALRESETRYRHLFNQAPDSIMLMRLGDGPAPVIFEANEATERMHGMTREEIIGKPISQLDAPRDRAHVKDRVERIKNGETVAFEAEHLRGDGSVFPVEVIARMIEIDGRPVIQAIDRDISGRKQAEEEKRDLEAQFVQAQKMEAIGRLAGGIAHDMNNVLAAILGSASLMEDEVTPETPQRERLDHILAACRRGRDITRNFLGFARKGRFVKERVCLNDLVVETTNLLRHTISRKIAIEIDLDPDVGCIQGDRGLVNQALMNLCINSTDAMVDEGTLTIATETVMIEDPSALGIEGIEPGAHSKITVKDTGSGMDDETLRQAFEPFFTTKSAQKGTGLGLSMVYGTVVSHDGATTIESKPGSGTTITMIFPTSTDPMPVTPVRPREAEEVSAPDEGCVLLVDDEKLLRFVGRQMIEGMGFTAKVAGNGREAVEIYRRDRDEIDLVVLDLVMPEMDGPEAFRNLQAIDPEVRVLISSGFTSDETVEELIQDGARGFIEKPFDKVRFRRAVAEALGSSSPIDENGTS